MKLAEIKNFIEETDFLYQHYIETETLSDYSLPMEKAIYIVEELLSHLLVSVGVEVNNGEVLVSRDYEGNENYERVAKYIISLKNSVMPDEYTDFIEIVVMYSERLDKGLKCSRGELYEFINAYKCFLYWYFSSVYVINVFDDDKESLQSILEYISKSLEKVVNIKCDNIFANTITGVGVSAIMAPMMAISKVVSPVLEMASWVPGLPFFSMFGSARDRSYQYVEDTSSDLNVYDLGTISETKVVKNLKKYTRKTTYEDTLVSNDEYYNRSKDVSDKDLLGVQRSDSELENKAQEEMKKHISEVVSSSVSEIKECINDNSKEIQVKIDNIARLLDELKNQITSYQKFVKAEMEIATSTDEIERIVHVYSDTCVNMIVEGIDKKYSELLRTEETNKLRASLGEEAWNKLSEESKNYLVSAKVTFSYYSYNSSLDYSGVCLLVTKALEVELTKRFYKDYTNYLKKRYNDSFKKHLDEFPTPFLKRINHTKVLKRQKEITLGSIPFILCAKNDRNASEQELENNKTQLLTYAKGALLRNAGTDEEILEMMIFWGDQIEEIKERYRNKAAHTNELNRVDAEECFDIVLDVEKLLKRLLDSFLY